MICECQNLSKKVNLLNGIKKLTGDLLYYEINNNKYINECCFTLIISSLYSIHDINWINNSIDIIHDETLKRVFKLENYILNDLIYWIPSKCNLAKIDDPIRIAKHEFQRMYIENKQMYKSLIDLDKKYNNIIYNYNALKHDKQMLTAEIDNIQKNKHDDTNNTEQINKCVNCKTFEIIKDELKLIKKESYDKINKYFYDLEIANKKIIELKISKENLLDEINKLRDTNHTLSHNYLREFS